MKEINLFEGIISEENDYTQLLYNLLQFPEVETKFKSLLNDKLSLNVDFTFSDINIQKTTEEGRPDLIIETKGFCCIIEVKKERHCKISHSQEEGYISFLQSKPQKEKGYCFLIPYRYKYREQVEDIIEKAKKNNIKGAIIYWREIVKIFEEIPPLKFNLFQEVYDFFSANFWPFKIKISKKEVDTMKEYIKDVTKILKLLGATIAQIKDNIKFRDILTDHNEIGIYTYPDAEKKKEVWFGYWFEVAEKYGYPLVIAIHPANEKSEEIKKFQEKHKLIEPFIEREYKVIPLPDEILTTEDNVDRIVKLVEELLEILK